MMLSPGLLAKSVKLTFKGYLHGIPNGDELQLPADFIIGRDMRIEFAHYGKDPSDSVPAAEIVRLLKGNK